MLHLTYLSMQCIMLPLGTMQATKLPYDCLEHAVHHVAPGTLQATKLPYDLLEHAVHNVAPGAHAGHQATI